jgi:hypothetical protein
MTTWNRGCRAAAIVALAALLGSLACSQASRSLHYSSPSAEPGVVYVAEQVFGLDDWAKSPDSRSYARVTTRMGQAEEGPLVRITQGNVVIQQRERGELSIDKHDVLFMRVWW